VLKHTFAVKLCCAPSARLAVAGETEIAGVQVCAAMIVTAAVADFDGSAALVATMEMLGEAGTVDGAVYVAVSPFVASVPQPEPHALPVRLQFMAVLGFPVPVTCAVKVWLAPVVTEAVAGEIVT
jgi:hypothetical protein